MSQGSVGSVRIYCDIVQYAQAIGKVRNYGMNHIDNSRSEASHKVWTMSPYNYNQYTNDTTTQSDRMNWVANLSKGEYTYESDIDYNFCGLISSANYAAVLGHNLQSSQNAENSDFPTSPLGCSVEVYGKDVGSETDEYITANYIKNIINTSYNPTLATQEGDGFSMWEIKFNDMSYNSMYKYSNLVFNIYGFDDEGDNSDRTGSRTQEEPFYFPREGEVIEQTSRSSNINIGALSVGKYFDFPNVDLTINRDYQHKEINNTQTLAGYDYTTIYNYKSPSWGPYGCFTVSKFPYPNYDTTSQTGRRSWNLKFSYVDNTDIFTPKQGKHSSFGSWHNESTTELEHNSFKPNDTITGFLSLTLGGQLPFVFCPNHTYDENGDVDSEFALCKVVGKTIKFSQVAHNVWSVSMTISEIW
ncbi:MAG: hypothetical protein Tp152DCM223801_14 [Prokaryotic dsDNA virus sp.]|nr:MAG: hypothetical protein Tp152DCM223801_14 [Prokaryotic dsDNA virus sp.]|tara:strand:+ start:14159 stop:15403 length:1245 start_codon:yes stop_codon:yes gene_type:complete